VVALSLLLQASNTLALAAHVLAARWLVGSGAAADHRSWRLLALRHGRGLCLAGAGPRRRTCHPSRYVNRSASPPGGGGSATCRPSDQMLERVRDDVARKSCARNGSRWIADLARGDAVLVLLGGRLIAGKTSLNPPPCSTKWVGEVGAPMGSTADCNSLQLRLKGPALRAATGGHAGHFSKQAQWPPTRNQCRQRAGRADLLSLVVTGICGPRNWRCSRPSAGWQAV